MALAIAQRVRYPLGQVAVCFALGVVFGVPFVLYRPALGASVEHARWLVGVERSLRFGGVELWFQRASVTLGLEGFFSALYYFAQLVGVWLVVAVLVVVAEQGYRRMRAVMCGTWALSLVVFVIWPVAPPSASGDVVHRLAVNAQALASQPYDSLASMPSLHVACACAAAFGVSGALGRRRWRHVVWLWPLLVAVTTLATANHYLLDVLAGAGLAVVVARIYDRERCRAA